MLEKASDGVVFSEWWEIITEWSSAIFDKITLAVHWGLPVGMWGETSLDSPLAVDELQKIRVIEEALCRGFPPDNHDPYIGPKNGERYPRAYIQWCLHSVYNIGFKVAIKAVEEHQKRTDS